MSKRLDYEVILREAGFEKDRIETDHFSVATPLPYVVIIYGKTNPYNADDKTLARVQNIVVELYTDKKREPKLIHAVSEVLDRYDIIFETAEDYIESEKTYRVSFYFEEMIE